MKTILHICKYYSPDEGGIETVAKYLAEGLAEFQNIVVCFSTDGRSHVDNINGISVHRFAPAFKAFSQDVVFSFYWKLKKLIRECRPNVINIHCPNPFVYPFVVALAPQGCKISLLWHADILSKGVVYNLIKPFETHALKRADRIIVTSPNYIHPSSPIYAYKEKAEVLPNAVITANLDAHVGDEQRIKEIKAKYDNKPIVMFVGRHVPYKGIDLLIEAEKYIKCDCQILIMGRGPQTDYLMNLSKSNRIHFLGKVSNEELRCSLYAADVFAFPSVTKAEAFGVALAEGMYCGCAPVTFTLDGSGVNWVSIKNETGEEVPLRDTLAFANAIDRLLSDKELLAKYKENSKRRVRTFFTDKKSVEIAQKIFNNLLS